MLKYIRKLFKLSIFFISLNSIGYAIDLTIDKNLQNLKIGKYLSYYEDRANSLSIKDIRSGKYDADFIKSDKEYLSFGYSRSSYWIKFTTENPTTEKIKWYLEYDYPLIDYITFYYKTEDGYKKINTGDRISFNSRPFNYRKFIFPIEEAPGKRNYYMRVASEDTLLIKLTAWAPDDFKRKIDSEAPLLWISYGILIALAIYNLFIYFSVREKAYIYLFLLISLFSFFIFIENGFANQYLWPECVWWGNICQPVFIFWIIAVALQFTRSFLKSRINFLSFDKLLRSIIKITFLCMLLPFILEYYYVIQISAILSIIGSLVMIAGGAVALIKGVRQAYFYMCSWIFFLIGALLILFRVFAILPDNFLTTYGYQIGFVIMSLLFSLGIADMINTIRSERMNALEALAGSEKKYRSIFKNATEGIFQTNFNSKLITANPAAASIFGFDSPDEMINSIDDLKGHFFHDANKRNEFNRLMIKHGKVNNFEFKTHKKDKSIMDVSINVHSVVDENNNIIYYEGIINDISHRKRAEELYKKNILLQELAISDSLTGIYNNKYIKERLYQEIFESKRYNHDLSIIMFDIDYFKQINDKYGHQFGDVVLINISLMIKEEIRITDIPGRFGGEEFLIILPNTDIDNAIITAERVRKKIECSVWKFDELNITISGGIADLHDEGIDELINKADKFLYEAKYKGRNRIEHQGIMLKFQNEKNE